MKTYRFQIAQFEEKEQRFVEKALSIDFCLKQNGRLVYEPAGKPFIKIVDSSQPLAITHTKGIHLIGMENVGVDVEVKTRNVSLRPGWLLGDNPEISTLDWLMMGEACLKLNFWN